jgi:hypothetical protein
MRHPLVLRTYGMSACYREVGDLPVDDWTYSSSIRSSYS